MTAATLECGQPATVGAAAGHHFGGPRMHASDRDRVLSRPGMCAKCGSRVPLHRRRGLPKKSYCEPCGLTFKRAPLDRLMSYVAMGYGGVGPGGSECWVWIGSGASGLGHATIGFRKTRVGAHKAVYELMRGSVPTGLHLDHLCRNPRCVNPDHLEPVTPAENVRRGFSPSAIANRTRVCRNGHNMSYAGLSKKTGCEMYRCRVCRVNREAQLRAHKESTSAIGAKE